MSPKHLLVVPLLASAAACTTLKESDIDSYRVNPDINPPEIDVNVSEPSQQFKDLHSTLLVWNPVDDASGFQVQRIDPDKEWRTLSPDEDKDSPLHQGTAYTDRVLPSRWGRPVEVCYRVRSVTDGTVSEWSQPHGGLVPPDSTTGRSPDLVAPCAPTLHPDSGTAGDVLAAISNYETNAVIYHEEPHRCEWGTCEYRITSDAVTVILAASPADAESLSKDNQENADDLSDLYDETTNTSEYKNPHEEWVAVCDVVLGWERLAHGNVTEEQRERMLETADEVAC